MANPVSELNAYVTKTRLGSMTFEDAGRYGPPHMMMFVCRVVVGERIALGGQASTKSQAKQLAAREWLRLHRPAIDQAIQGPSSNGVPLQLDATRLGQAGNVQNGVSPQPELRAASAAASSAQPTLQQPVAAYNTNGGARSDQQGTLGSEISASNFISDGIYASARELPQNGAPAAAQPALQQPEAANSGGGASGGGGATRSGNGATCSGNGACAFSSDGNHASTSEMPQGSAPATAQPASQQPEAPNSGGGGASGSGNGASAFYSGKNPVSTSEMPQGSAPAAAQPVLQQPEAPIHGGGGGASGSGNGASASYGGGNSTSTSEIPQGSAPALAQAASLQPEAPQSGGGGASGSNNGVSAFNSGGQNTITSEMPQGSAPAAAQPASQQPGAPIHGGGGGGASGSGNGASASYGGGNHISTSEMPQGSAPALAQPALQQPGAPISGGGGASGSNNGASASYGSGNQASTWGMPQVSSPADVAQQRPAAANAQGNPIPEHLLQPLRYMPRSCTSHYLTGNFVGVLYDGLNLTVVGNAPTFAVTWRGGTDHVPQFVVELTINNRAACSQPCTTKAIARQAAAKEWLRIHGHAIYKGHVLPAPPQAAAAAAAAPTTPGAAAPPPPPPPPALPAFPSRQNNDSGPESALAHPQLTTVQPKSEGGRAIPLAVAVLTPVLAAPVTAAAVPFVTPAAVPLEPQVEVNRISVYNAAADQRGQNAAASQRSSNAATAAEQQSRFQPLIVPQLHGSPSSSPGCVPAPLSASSLPLLQPHGSPSSSSGSVPAPFSASSLPLPQLQPQGSPFSPSGSMRAPSSSSLPVVQQPHGSSPFSPSGGVRVLSSAASLPLPAAAAASGPPLSLQEGRVPNDVQMAFMELNKTLSKTPITLLAEWTQKGAAVPRAPPYYTIKTRPPVFIATVSVEQVNDDISMKPPLRAEGEPAMRQQQAKQNAAAAWIATYARGWLQKLAREAAASSSSAPHPNVIINPTQGTMQASGEASSVNGPGPVPNSRVDSRVTQGGGGAVIGNRKRPAADPPFAAVQSAPSTAPGAMAAQAARAGAGGIGGTTNSINPRALQPFVHHSYQPRAKLAHVNGGSVNNGASEPAAGDEDASMVVDNSSTAANEPEGASSMPPPPQPQPTGLAWGLENAEEGPGNESASLSAPRELEDSAMGEAAARPA